MASPCTEDNTTILMGDVRPARTEGTYIKLFPAIQHPRKRVAHIQRNTHFVGEFYSLQIVWRQHFENFTLSK